MNEHACFCFNHVSWPLQLKLHTRHHHLYAVFGTVVRYHKRAVLSKANYKCSFYGTVVFYQDSKQPSCRGVMLLW